MKHPYLFLFALVIFAGSAYAAVISPATPNQVGGTQPIPVPTGVVQLGSVSLLLGSSTNLNSGGQLKFDTVRITLTAQTAGTYNVYVTVIVGGTVVQGQTFSGVSLSSTATTLTTSTMATAQPAKNVEVDVAATP
jgi:hypothetical protein